MRAPCAAACSLILLANGLHCADLGNPCKPLGIYLNWTERLIEEFHRQGDRERERGLPVSLMMDRHKPNVERSQVGFIDVICLPLWATLADITPELSPCLQLLHSNRRHWLSRLPPATPKTHKAQQTPQHRAAAAAQQTAAAAAGGGSEPYSMAALTATNPAFVVPMS